MYITKFFNRLFKNLRYQKILNQAYEQDKFIQQISTLIGVQFYRDWIGRIYAVVNPNIRDGQYNREQIIEFTERGGADNTMWVERWIMEKFNLIRDYIQTANLFDALVFNITKIDNNSNYLFVIEPITLQPVFNALKAVCVELGVIGTIVAGWLIFF